MKRLLAACLLLAFVAGCSITLSDNGEISVAFTQGFTVSHKTAKTGAESKASTDLQSLVDYIIKLRGSPEPTTQPARKEPGVAPTACAPPVFDTQPVIDDGGSELTRNP